MCLCLKMDAVTRNGHEVHCLTSRVVKQYNGPLQNPATLVSKRGHVTEKWGTNINMLKWQF